MTSATTFLQMKFAMKRNAPQAGDLNAIVAWVRSIPSIE
jgi:hypothetical protein